jgi:hypothetical protein
MRTIIFVRKIFLAFAIFMLAMSMSLFGQKQILQLDTVQNYTAKSFMDRYVETSIPVIFYEVVYELPNEFDRGYTHSLSIDLIDTAALKQGKVFNIAKDTGIVKCNYTHVTSSMLLARIMNPDFFPVSMIGTIRVISWATDSIEFEFDIAVKEGIRKGFLFYQGRKKLSRAEREIPDWLKTVSKKDSP